MSRSSRLRNDLLRIDNGEPDLVRRLVLSPPQSAIRARMADRLKQYGFVGFVIIGPKGTVLAADQDPAISQTLAGERKQFVESVMGGQSTVSKPYRSPLLLPNEKGDLQANLPSMFAGARSATPPENRLRSWVCASGPRINSRKSCK